MPGVRGDPAISSPGTNQGLATWTFSNATDYTAVNASLADAAASLAWTSTVSTDTAPADFAAALVQENVNASGPGGDVVIANTSQPGPLQNLTWQPDPTELSDNYLSTIGGGRGNYGTADDLTVGNRSRGVWDRAVLAFPTLPLPANATLVSANLDLYMFDPISTGLMYFSAHRMLANWTEMGSTWITRDGLAPWNASGGEFDPTILDIAAGIRTTPGWFTWNITSLALGWWTGTVANDGVMIRQVDDTITAGGLKDFYSSDAANVSYRPQLLLEYTLPGSRGLLESEPIDAGGRATWSRVSWNGTLPTGTALGIRTRSGDGLPVNASWSPWTALAPGGLVTSPPGRYLQYALDLYTTTATSPAVHDVSVGFALYAATGRVEAKDFAPASLAGWGTLSLNASLPAGTSAQLVYSQDSGGSWLPAASGANLSSATVGGIRLRILLATNDTTQTPTVHRVALAYRVVPGSEGVPPESPWTSIPVLLILGAMGGMLLGFLLRARGFRPTELFLIHADGRLVARVGTEEMQDELAASAVFTLVAQFVRDSFRGPRGTGGELKSLQVDEREVSIARGRFLYLALVSQGTRPSQLSDRMYAYLEGLEANYGARLQAWDGMRAGNEALERDLARFLRKGCRKGAFRPF